MQVILWTDDATLQMNESYKFRAEVETRNMTALIPQMVNSDIMAKLANVGAVTDLMKYEVRPGGQETTTSVSRLSTCLVESTLTPTRTGYFHHIIFVLSLCDWKALPKDKSP